MASMAAASACGIHALRLSSRSLQGVITSATRIASVCHRFYHKLNGFTGSHDYQLCVGCGRCVYACKANINPIEVLKFFDRKGAEADGE